MADGQDMVAGVDGIGLAVRVTGARSPAVVMVSSSGGAHEQWDQLRERLGDTLCVTYGRPGLGGSAAMRPEESMVERAAGWAANQLQRLLGCAAIAPPYVLVGCSIGGWITDQLAAGWPPCRREPKSRTASPRLPTPPRYCHLRGAAGTVILPSLHTSYY